MKLPVRTRGLCMAAALLAAGCASSNNAGTCPAVTPLRAGEAQRPLLEPGDARFQATPPDTFHVRFETSKGEFVLQVVREWAPLGAAQFYNLVRNGFYDDTRFFRVLPGFVVQFGVSGVPDIQTAWDAKPLTDDPVRWSNVRGTISFATAGPNTRTTQVFINLENNTQLDGMGFSPFGRVVQGHDVLDQLYSAYGEMAPMGAGPAPECMASGGNAYFNQEFERLDAIRRASIIP